MKYNRRTKYSKDERMDIVTYKYLRDYDQDFAIDWIERIWWKRYHYIADKLIIAREFTAAEEKYGTFNALYIYTVMRFHKGDEIRFAAQTVASLALKKTDAEKALEEEYARVEGVIVEMKQRGPKPKKVSGGVGEETQANRTDANALSA